MFYTYSILFFTYSFIGWLMEVILSIYNEHKFVNRGFLLGPCCPIYGFGSLLLYFLLKNYTNNFIVLFILTMFICSLLEYTTSYIMEKIFKLRWWDYTNMKYNLNGRICLETMIPFSLLGALTIKYVTPNLIKIINNFSLKVTLTISIILITIFIVDIIISLIIVFRLKLVAKDKKDSTIDIKKAISKFIKNDLYVYERILKAFPNLNRKRK